MSSPTKWRMRHIFAVLMSLALVAAACGSDGDSSDTSSDAEEPAAEEPAAEEPAAEEPAAEEPAAEEPAAEEPADDEMSSGELPAPGTPERCELNQAAGKLTFMTGFDFAADAGILDVVVAEAEGFFDDMCLDVELQSGLAPANIAALASGTTQLGAMSAFGAMVRQNVAGDADLVAWGQYGHTSLSTLLVPADGDVQEVADLQGTQVGIKGDLPPSIEAMLESQGVPRGSFDELLLEGFDPVAHFDLGIDALPVFKSNEPRILDNAGYGYIEFDPLDYGIPGSFALYATTRSFYEEHPTVVEDFVRAGLRGYEFAAENPEAAIDHAFERIETAGNQFFLAKEHELFRWSVELELIQTVTPDGYVVGQIDPELLGGEVQSLVELGVFEELPDWESMYDDTLVPTLYDDSGALIWEPMR